MTEVRSSKSKEVQAQSRATMLTHVITVLMRSPQHKHFMLADLEWLVFPPLAAGQIAVANVQAAKDGPPVPAAIALWASVSAEVDQKLSANLTTPLRLRPDEWRSGDILWLIDVIGDERVVPGFLGHLKDAFQGREVKIRVPRGGKMIVSTLRETLPPPLPSSPIEADDEKISF